MLKSKLFLSFFLFTSLLASAQYTETINSNRPGQSQGAYAVGVNVLQLETGGYFGNDEHSLYHTSTDLWGIDYTLRYGIISENLELNLSGAFENRVTSFDVAGHTQENTISNFRYNTIGAKFLLFNPERDMEPWKPSIRSWKANQGIKWQDLIPAVSVYGGANFSFGDNPYLYEGEAKFSPKAAIVTQNNWGQWVLVLNFIADKFTEDHPIYEGIATLTHTFSPKFAIFGEYQGIINDLYADDIFRAGAAYLFTKDLQADVSGLVNFKDTPSRWQLAAGLSYRLDMHSEDDYLEEQQKEMKEQPKRRFGRSEGKRN